ncbi:MAG: glycoside hydrolase family 130 protein [Phycisphaerae bacterium]|nr:glycoside hydrolase family 130 protein [Phycisphaerae bacterium]
MSNDKQTIIGPALTNIPWEDKPAGCDEVAWRYSGNPVIPRDLIPCANSIFNSAVIPFEGKFVGVFRVDDKRRHMQLHCGQSEDGINWRLDNEPIEFICDDPEIAEFICGYDPRVCWIEDRYYITWCNAYRGLPTIGVAWTLDFKEFHQLENAFLPFNRNGVMFPRKINGKFAMLSRPSDNGHTPFGDIFYSESPDMCHWGKHRFAMGALSGQGWQATKIGAGPIPIETTAGWLLIYHGVLTSCNGFNYSAGAALLDIDEPWKVIARTEPYILNPRETYECVGDVPNVLFPCAALADAATGRIAIYYGGADTVVGMAFTQVDELIDFIKANSIA